MDGPGAHRTTLAQLARGLNVDVREVSPDSTDGAPEIGGLDGFAGYRRAM